MAIYCSCFLSLQLCHALTPYHHPMGGDLVMILHLVRQSITSVTQATRSQEAGAEPVQPQVPGVGYSRLVQVKSVSLVMDLSVSP